ncbi:hypothetical protein SteCoe_12541 [Stentor coeruleus]|uniref:FYVE-type domain-containing protein n=1 Tax=Stentor coeruleus TaxID=5963 RepID=A0A1R2CAK7_9CILI|nr:hypothetical protein SteCoe_12541 [Stentor coeruleus]
MISNTGASSILKNSVHGTESTMSSAPSMLSSHLDMRKTTNPSTKGSFESLNSLELSQTSSKNCCVCNKTFTLKKRYFCQFCQNAVCSEHSSKTRLKPNTHEAQRICDICEGVEAQKDIQNEINEEFNKLQDELVQAKEINERLNRDFFEKTSILNEYEKKITLSDIQHKKKVESMKEENFILVQQTEKTKLLLETLKKTLENTRENHKDMTEKHKKVEEEIESLQLSSVEIKKNTEDISRDIDLIGAKIKSTANFDSICKSLCQRCQNRLGDTFNKIHNTQYWLQETEEEEKIL